jgi:hypothetical protein
MKKWKSIATLFIILNSCAGAHWSNYWPYSRIAPKHLKKQNLNSFEDCLNNFDLVLQDTAINYFKNQDSSIATIEICKAIGGYFITNWNLNAYGETKGTTYENDLFLSNDAAPNVVREFYIKKVKDPEAMIRILFSAYHKKLNGKPYSFENEINELKSFWVNPKVIYRYSLLSDSMRIRENRIINNYELNTLSINDTVVCRLSRAPRAISKKPDMFYLEAIVNFKVPRTGEVNLRLLKIESDKPNQGYHFANDTLHVGDTLTDYPLKWHNRNKAYFDYNRNRYY